ncbi:MAG: response regulator [Magnetococcales bacterium]|nr:response regulator [Magnetococcales bacterium]
MKILIADDELNNCTLLQKLLEPYGISDIVVDGLEAVDAFVMAHADGEPYELICMDIMMPEMDGNQAVKAIRQKEQELGVTSAEEVKILMVTALDSPKDVMNSFYKAGCSDYLVKPLSKDKVDEKMLALGYTL